MIALLVNGCASTTLDDTSIRLRDANLAEPGAVLDMDVSTAAEGVTVDWCSVTTGPAGEGFEPAAVDWLAWLAFEGGAPELAWGLVGDTLTQTDVLAVGNAEVEIGACTATLPAAAAWTGSYDPCDDSEILLVYGESGVTVFAGLDLCEGNTEPVVLPAVPAAVDADWCDTTSVEAVVATPGAPVLDWSMLTQAPGGGALDPLAIELVRLVPLDLDDPCASLLTGEGAYESRVAMTDWLPLDALRGADGAYAGIEASESVFLALHLDAEGPPVALARLAGETPSTARSD